MSSSVQTKTSISTVLFTQKLQTLEIALKAKDDRKIRAAFSALSKPERIALTDRVKLVKGRNVLDKSQQRKIELLAVQGAISAIRKADSSSSSSTSKPKASTQAPFRLLALPKAVLRLSASFLHPKDAAHTTTTCRQIHTLPSIADLHLSPTLRPFLERYANLRPAADLNPPTESEKLKALHDLREIAKQLCHLEGIALKPTYANLSQIFQIAEARNLIRMFEFINRNAPLPDLIGSTLENLNIPADSQGAMEKAAVLRKWIQEHQGLLSIQNRLDFDTSALTLLPPEIGQFTALQNLYLSHNYLVALPREIDQLAALQNLNLHNNRLAFLPREIGQLAALRNLNLHNNRLAFLPREIGQLAALQILAVSRNRLITLPREIGQLTALIDLHLFENRLAALPREIGQLVALQDIDLCQNRLAFLPREIVRLTALRNLSLSSNRLVSLPREIGQLAALLRLHLRDNRLVTLPREISQLAKLEELILDENRLLALPREINRLQLEKLNEFTVSGNGLIDMPHHELDQSKTLQLENIAARLTTCLRDTGDPKKISKLLDSIDSFLGKEMRSSLHRCLAKVCDKAWKEGNPLRDKLKDPKFGRKAFLDPAIDPKLKLAALAQFSKLAKNFFKQNAHFFEEEALKRAFSTMAE